MFKNLLLFLDDNMAKNDSLRILSELENDIGKAVQLYVRDIPILAIEHNDFFFHGDILDKILEEMCIPFERIKLGDGTYHAQKQGDLYVAVGMGWADFWPRDEKKIYLSGDSMGYGLKIDKEHTERVNSRLDGFEVVLQK